MEYCDIKARNEMECCSKSGVSIINAKFGKACSVIDYIIDTGGKFRFAWA